MTPHATWPVAIIGSGEIGADLMAKIGSSDSPLTVAATAGVDGLLAMPHFGDIRMVFDATSVAAHRANWAQLRHTGVRMLDLTPSPIGPYCVPAVNLDDCLDVPCLSMATGDAQAAVPVVAAVAQSGIVSYAETVSSISSAAARPDTRASIDDLNHTTVAACRRIESDVLAMVDKVRTYVPGYRLKRRIQFESFSTADPLYIPETGKFTGTRVTVLLEIIGEADYVPAHAGNVDLLTAAAKAAAERIAARDRETAGLPT